MNLFTSILIKLIPLYFMIILGYIAGKNLSVQKETIAKLLIYIIAPVVIFYGTYTAEISPSTLSLPILFFAFCSFMGILFLNIGSYFYKDDSTKNILAFAAGTGNTGYFGIPLVAIILGDHAFSLAIMTTLGFAFYENSVGFYITAKGNYSVRESVMKVAKLPTIYAFFLGLLLNYLNIDFDGEILYTNVGYFKGAYTLLGMMMIGLGMKNVELSHIDLKFISLAFLARFIVWPIMIIGTIFLDKAFFASFNEEIYNVMILIAIVPLAANTVTIATELKCHPDKAAVAVLCSTMFALFYIPLITSIMMF